MKVWKSACIDFLSRLKLGNPCGVQEYDKTLELHFRECCQILVEKRIVRYSLVFESVSVFTFYLGGVYTSVTF